jgi:hypothetical protein
MISVNNAVSVTIVQGAGDLSAELPSLLVLQPPMRDYIVEHLPPIDVFKEHIPMICSAHNVSHSTYIWVIQKGDNSCFSCCADLLRMISPFSICPTLVVSIVCRATGNDLYSDLKGLVSPNHNMADC